MKTEKQHILDMLNRKLKKSEEHYKLMSQESDGEISRNFFSGQIDGLKEASKLIERIM